MVLGYRSSAVVVPESCIVSPTEQDLTGRRLSHYQTVERIGAGGMGVVYRAIDTRLDRTVAIKVLRPGSAGPEHQRRFLQEAKTASALNHPNIVTIYEIDEAEGVTFIAMEYVVGRRLDQLIGKGLPIEETLHYAVQIASALGAAHAAGIIHRDVKPSNVMVSAKGLVKVLDFGLAKLADPPIVGDQTVSMQSDPLTTWGTIVGTLAYMSPEQVEGKRIDTRSDIFAFGSTLYEMTTGRMAFARETAVSTLVAIASREPTSIRTMLKDPPAGLEQVISGCLRKEPDSRYQAMEDVKADLEALHHDSWVWDTSALRRSKSPGLRRNTRRIWMSAAGIGLAAVLAGVFWVWRSTATNESWRPILTRLTADKGMSAFPALSSDGKLLAYASDRSGEGNLDIWVQQVGGGNPIRVTHDTADEYEPAFSPDGAQIAFHSDSGGGGIWVVPSFGGPARIVADHGRRPLFSPDGKQIVYWVGSGTGKVYLVSAQGGQPREFQPEFESARYPVWSSDGKWVLFLGTRDSKGVEPTGLSGESLDWWIAPSAGGRAVKTGALEVFRQAGMSAPFGERLMSPDTWTMQNDVVFSARLGGTTNVWRIAISPSSHRVKGAPQRLSLGTQLESQARFVTLPDGSSRMVFASFVRGIDVWGLPLDTKGAKVTGELERLTQDQGFALSPAVSRDGKRLVYISTRSGNADVYLKDFATGKETVIAMGPPDKSVPSISPDGSAVAYVDSVTPKVAGIFSVSIDQEGRLSAPKKVCEPCAGGLSWSSDGRSALIGRYPPARSAMVDLATGNQVEILRHSKYNVWQKTFSPDDRWISFNMVVNPLRSNLYVVRVPAKPALVPVDEWIPVTEGENWDDKPRWSPDGNTLYFISQRDGFRCIWYQRLDPQTKHPVGDPTPLYHLHRSRLSMVNLEVPAIEMGVGADKLVFALGELTGNIWMAQVQSNLNSARGEVTVNGSTRSRPEPALLQAASHKTAIRGDNRQPYRPLPSSSTYCGRAAPASTLPARILARSQEYDPRESRSPRLPKHRGMESDPIAPGESRRFHRQSTHARKSEAGALPQIEPGSNRAQPAAVSDSPNLPAAMNSPKSPGS